MDNPTVRKILVVGLSVEISSVGAHAMPEPKNFKGFFSSSRVDTQDQPSLINRITRELENRVNANIVNAHFKIWRDTKGIHIGDAWNPKIEAELRSSDILIVLLTPRWITSPYATREYTIFKEIEANRIGNYIIPVLFRSLDQQLIHLTEEQRRIYDNIIKIQHISLLVEEFANFRKAKRDKIIKEISDDIIGMIDLRRSSEKIPNPGEREDITLENIALLHTSFYSENGTQRMNDGLRYYQFEVIAVAPDEVMNRISSVTYYLEESWPKDNRKQTVIDRGSRFKMKELANGTSIVWADVTFHNSDKRLMLNRFIDLRPDGPRI
jgi:hypothetical protein